MQIKEKFILIKERYWIFVLLIFSYNSKGVCLNELEIKDLPVAISDLSQRSISVYTSDDKGIEKIPSYLSHKKKKSKLDFSKAKVSKFDVIQFERKQFTGKKLAPEIVIEMALDCKDPLKKVVEVIDRSEVYYILWCHNVPAIKSNITADLKKRIVKSPNYEYRYSKENNLLFDSISLFESTKPLIKNSDLLIHSDFKYFFTMNFDSSDIKSSINNTRFSSFGLEADVSFYLKLLFFKIKLSLVTDAYFYDDLVVVPMVMHIPKSANEHVNPGSSILYYWDILKGHFEQSVHMPNIGPKSSLISIENEKKRISEVLRNYCSLGICRFNINYGFGDFKSVLDFEIPYHLVKKGFYPQYFSKNPLVDKDGEIVTELKEIEDGYKRQGVYFDYSKLTRGSHRWDFRIKFEKNKKQCGINKVTSSNLKVY